MSNIRDDFVDESRTSQDLIVNNFGRSLLSMCAALELTTLIKWFLTSHTVR